MISNKIQKFFSSIHFFDLSTWGGSSPQKREKRGRKRYFLCNFFNFLLCISMNLYRRPQNVAEITSPDLCLTIGTGEVEIFSFAPQA